MAINGDGKQTRCSHLDTCPMFAVFGSQASGRIFKTLYCEGKFVDCMRYQRSERGQSVPDNMLPNGQTVGTVK